MICEMCFHHCDLPEGQTGFCRARACRDGAIVPLNYGKAVSLALDPIEKKPLRRTSRPRRWNGCITWPMRRGSTCLSSIRGIADAQYHLEDSDVS